MSSEFGQYRRLRLLGEGGMARVWAARHEAEPSGRRALKILKEHLAGSAEQRQMLLEEGRRVQALGRHANVAWVHDVGEHQGRPFLAMEFVDGMTLAELAGRVGKPWPVAAAVAMAASLLQALDHIHRGGPQGKGLVHRDVTPHNVMVSKSGEVKLIDFGIAEPTDAPASLDQALGTLSYVPREQVEGELDIRSDLFAVGAVLFELLDGRRFRWHCADEDALFQDIYRDRIPTLRRNDVPAAVETVMRGLLAPYRDQRPPTAAEALRGLATWEGYGAEPDLLQRLYTEAAGSPVTPRPRRSSASARAAAAKASWSRPWGEARPTARAPVATSAPGGPRPDHVSTQQHPLSAAAVADTDGLASAGSEGGVERRRRSRSAPVWAASGEHPKGNATATRIVPAEQRNPELGADDMERRVTRYRPAALADQDVPTARNSAEIAVTRPLPSRRAPWAAGIDPVPRQPAREPGAPVPRPRLRRAAGLGGDRIGSVSPRAHQSAAMHEAAAGDDLVTGEIIVDDGLSDAHVLPSWRDRSA